MSDFDQARWDGAHQAVVRSPLLDAIRRSTLNGALPAGVRATTVWPSWSLDVLAAELRLPDGGVLLDVACGMGEIGRWIARACGASVLGVEPSPIGRGEAEANAADGDRYVDGVFGAIGVGRAVADAALVVDALQFAPDRVAALRDIADAVVPGGRLVVVGPGDAPVEAAGLRVVRREETPGWRAANAAFQATIAERADELRGELGDASVENLLSLPKAHADEHVWHGMTVAAVG